MNALIESELVNTLDALSASLRIVSAFTVLPTSELTDSVNDKSLLRDVSQVLQVLNTDSDEILEGFQSVTSVKKAKGQGNEGVSQGDETSATSMLRRDYTRLFSHPTHPEVYPYQAQYLYDPESNTPRPSAMINENAVSAQKHYREFGFEPSRSSGYVSPDHIAIEASFMGVLLDGFSDQLFSEECDNVQLNLYADAVYGFYNDHVADWWLGFFGDVAEKANTKTYKSVGLLGEVVTKKFDEILPSLNAYLS